VEETDLGRAVRVVTLAAIGLDHRIALVGRSELDVGLMTFHTVAVARTGRKV
jgi:hypothetical protein